MYQEIKDLAEKALALQNKDAMDKTLRAIVLLCNAPQSALAFNADSIALEELLSGRTMVINGRYVKLIDDDAPPLYRFGDVITETDGNMPVDVASMHPVLRDEKALDALTHAAYGEVTAEPMARANAGSLKAKRGAK